MKKYWAVAKNQFLKEFIIYRYFIISFAGGNFLELFSQVIVWTAIFRNLETVSGYRYNEMLSYIIIAWIFRFLTTTYDYETIIAKDIQLGRLTNIIIKPIDHLKYMFAYSLGRVAVAFCVVLFQALIWVMLFHDKLSIKSGPFTLAVLFIFFVFSYIIKFFTSMLIGIIGFWTNEVYGISKAAAVLVKILSGAYFPLDAAGGIFSGVALSFPFAYTLYYPVQIFLGRVGTAEIFKAIGILFIWTFVLWLAVKVLWKLGLKKYESAGI